MNTGHVKNCTFSIYHIDATAQDIMKRKLQNVQRYVQQFS